MSRSSEHEEPREAISRRTFLKGASGVAATGVIGSQVEGATAKKAGAKTAGQDESAGVSGPTEIVLKINGEERSVTVEPRTTLLAALRDRIEPQLTGTKLVCDRGNCGACTVLLDDKPVYSCLTLAITTVGKGIRTVEGVAEEGSLSPVQKAMLRHDGMMCGFCTPGFVMSLTGTLEWNPSAGVDEIKRGCAGNICRCGTYPHIFDAAIEAGREMRGGR